jgi:putative transposase
MLAPCCETDALLALFSPLLHEARSKYVDFVRAGVGLPPVWQGLEGQVFLGSREFMLEMQAKLGSAARLRDVPQLQRRAARVPLEHWAAQLPRDAAIAQAFASGHYRQRELAEFFGVS